VAAVDGTRSCERTVAASGGVAADRVRVLDRATEIAARTSHPHVGLEHVAMVALEGPDGLRAIAARAGVSPSRLATVLAECCPDPDGIGHPDATDATLSVLARAGQLAHLDGSTRIGSRHLVAALVHESAATLWIGLAAVDLPRLRVAVFMGGNPHALLGPEWDELPALRAPRRIH
jgi:ATP-dependent Clp protease ATP-binding subunit ClpA